MKRRLELTAEVAGTIGPGRFVRLPLGEPAWMPDGNLATSVLVGRVDGRLVAYANLCRHQPVPLDLGGTSIVAPDGENLICHAHGALYRPGDGRCVQGPCAGLALFPARVVASNGGYDVEL